MSNPGTSEKFEKITKLLIKKNLSVTTMESCTSGLIASLISDTEGASAIMKGAFVTYSNEAKIMLGVPSDTISTFGVYSKETSIAMAETCRKKFDATFGIGITGCFANEDPANKDSKPGEVFFSIAAKEKTLSFHQSVPTQKNRHAYKLYMADAVADEMLKLLE